MKILSSICLTCIFTAFSLWSGYASATEYTAQPPHNEYRTGYLGGCNGGAACHTVNKGIFTPQALDNSRPPNYSNFCLSCHNVTGEAHEKSVGWASTNAYVNFTGIDLTRSYSGDSHSWRGLNGNAGTRRPGFPAYTGYMPGGAVLCQTCHTGMSKTYEQEVAGASGEWLQAVDQGDSRNYRIPGYASTKQYLAKYLKVYRSPVSVSSPASRAKKAYQVYTGFTYNYQNATITFNRPQGQVGTVYIYANIPQPYFRVGNTGNAICVYCHNAYGNRSSSFVSHPPGSGVKSRHPVRLGYGYAFGSHTTLKPLPSGNVYLEYTAAAGGRLLCTTCHDPHNAPGKSGVLLREADPSNLCLDCHDRSKVTVHAGSKHQKYNNTSTIPTGCTECHSAHSSKNVYLVKSRLKSPQGAVKGVNFQNFTGSRSFGPDTGYGICEVCHSLTTRHLSSNDSSGRGHHGGEDCTLCHSHKNGFEPAGGSSPCYGCHDGDLGPNIKALMGLGTSFSQLSQGGKTSRHLIAFDNASGSSCLVMCHTSNHATGSPNLKTQPELALCGSCHSSGSQKTSQGRSINVMGRFGSALHNYTAMVQDEFGKFKYAANCTKCHVPHGSDNYPNVRPSINGKATNGNGEDLCFGCHDSEMNDGAVDIKSLWKANPANPGHIDATGRPMNCIKCHGPHGTGNEKMINDSLGGPGLTRDAICRSCHSGGGLSAYNVMTSAAGGYGPNFSAVSVHNFSSNVKMQVAVGGRTVDLTCYGCHDPHNTKNARHLREKIVFSDVSAAGAPSVVNVPPISAVVQPHGPTISYTSGWTSYCAICHTSLIETGGQSPYRRHPTGIGPGAFYPYTTGMGLKTLPLESGNVSCITCHYTHGSPKPKLQRIQSASTPENRLCLQCHDRTMFLQGGSGSHGGFQVNQGRCADCHSMHALANKRLLVEATETVLCVRCHADGGASQYKVWKALTSMNPYEMYGTGGTFGRYTGLRGGTAASMHQINEEDLPAPGGVTTQHRCGTCHNPHGSPNYRILRTSLNNVTGIRVYAKRDAQDKFIGYSSGFVKFCAACHANYVVTNDTSGNLIRHPVGVSLLNYTGELNFFINSTSYKPKVELESGYTISCVSCHYAHGSGVNANLKYPGGRSVNACKTCHNRDAYAAGTPGAHAGYTDNNGTCSDCHSMHAGGNPNLMKDTAETEICVNCHDYAAPQGVSTSPNRSHLVVWKGNVADAPASWLNTAGSFGTYKNNPTNGGDAPSMHGINGGAAIAPGDSATVVHCGTCHNSHGSPNYRLLKSSLNGNSRILVTGTTDANGNTIAHGSGMSGFCTACHKAYIICGSGSVAGYTRHPVDVALTPAEMANYNHFGGGSFMPLENLTTVNGVITHGTVTCITCHFAHGSPNEKMKRLGGTQMCQICHAKGLDAANNYQQVSNTHAGFSGNGGNCSACHSMHSAGNRMLLLYAEESLLCRSCHAEDGASHVSFPNAQVVWKGDSPATPSAWNGTGGSFGASYDPARGGSIKSLHLINKTDSQAPGGTTTQHHCGTCHNPHGNNNYRLLKDDVNGKPSGSIVVNATVAGGKTRYISGISSFCAACHTTYADAGTGVDGYNRHPVNMALSSQEMANLSTAATEPKVQLEGGNNVMCLSCHFAHGSPSGSMLRLQTYTSCRNSMCQQCHKKGYNAAGQQYGHTHGGFMGNEANCVVCHNMHSKGNKKLLNEAREADLCNDCHSGIDKFRTFQAANPAVKISAPSRFNVFSSIGNSFGNYSVGGGGVQSWHQVDASSKAPGGLTLNLRCGKCHNPHGEDNFVMIRSTVENITGIKVFGHLSSTGPFNTYSSGFGKFCAACHTRLTYCGTGNPWTRHPVDFKLQSKQLHNWSTTSITPRVPTESRSRVTCITCHNSHGSRNYRLMRLSGNKMCQQCHNR